MLDSCADFRKLEECTVDVLAFRVEGFALAWELVTQGNSSVVRLAHGRVEGEWIV